MKKIGIITFLRGLNFGGVLQAYGLYKSIETLGYQAEIVDYLPPSINQFQEFIPSFNYSSPLKSAIMYFYKGLLYRSQGNIMEEKYRTFIDENIITSTTKYSTDESLKEISGYDAFVCGSDIIWNPRHLAHRGFTLNFVPPGTPRIAYAPSFAADSIPERYHEFICEDLQAFASLSTREEQGKRIVREISGRDAEVVLDPTLLLTNDDWRILEAPGETRKPYVLCFTLYHDDYFVQLLKRIRKEHGLRVLYVYPHPGFILDVGSEKRFDVGPRDFLDIYRNASFVLSGSYHSVLFSINYRKPFYFIPDPRPSLRQRNARVLEVLRRFGLESRIVPESGLPSSASLEIDYSPSEPLIEAWRTKSLTYLSDALWNI